MVREAGIADEAPIASMRAEQCRRLGMPEVRAEGVQWVVAEDGGRVVATYAWMTLAMQGRPVLYVTDFYSEDSWRGRHGVEALLSHLNERSKTEGGVMGLVPTNNERFSSALLKRGWTESGTLLEYKPCLI